MTARQALLRIGAVLFGLGLLVGAEGAVRVLRLAPPAAPVLPAGGEAGLWSAAGGSGPLLRVDRTRGLAWPDREEVRARRMHDLRIAVTPPAGRVRVFTFGGSTTFGVPIEATPEKTWPGRLEARLREAGVDAEVVNLGGASFGSGHARALVEAAAALGPTVLVVYSANNEFFDYDLAMWEENRGYTGATQRLESLHLVRLLRRLVRPDPPATTTAQVQAASEAQEAAVRAALTDLVAGLPDDQLPAPPPAAGSLRRDPVFTAVVAQYEANLRAMAAAAAAARAPDGAPPLLLLVDVPANLLAAPELALPDPRRALGGRATVGDPRRDGCAAVLPQAERAVASDPLDARGWWARGVCRAGSAPDAPDWRVDLRTALELDFDPRRPPAAFSAVVRRVADETDAERFDPGAVLETPPPGRPSPFHDRCHLTEPAQDKLAWVLAARILDHLESRPGW